MSTRTRRAALTGAVVVVALLAGLLTLRLTHSGSGALDDADAAWRTSAGPVDARGFTWLLGTTVHLPDGSEVELEGATGDYVVAGDGVYWLRDRGSAERPGLHFTAADGSTTDTGLDLVPESLQASPDGRYLAGVDRSLTESTVLGVPLATVVVLDLVTGEEVVRSTEGMEPTVPFEDVEALYGETEIGGVAFVEGEVHVETADGDRAWDLTSGESRALEDGTVPDVPDPEPAPTSPDGRWRITDPGALADTMDAVDGAESVTPDTGTDRWVLRSWIDDRTTLGVAVDGPGPDGRIVRADTQTMVTCRVPTGDCETYDESTGETVWFPRNAAHGTPGLVLTLDDL